VLGNDLLCVDADERAPLLFGQRLHDGVDPLFAAMCAKDLAIVRRVLRFGRVHCEQSLRQRQRESPRAIGGGHGRLRHPRRARRRSASALGSLHRAPPPFRSRACHRAVLDALVTRCSHRCMGDWRRAQITAAAIATLVSLGGGCGAKTGLKIPCTTRFVPDAPEIMFVIDRSASMGEINAEGETHWTALDRALRTVIPQLQGVARVGMAFYPREGRGRDLCRADPVPAQAPTDDLVRLLREFPSSPVENGGTAIYEGLLASAIAMRSRRSADPGRQRFLILVTDGGAECNFDLPLDTCVCLSVTDERNCRIPPGFPQFCLDDARTLSLIEALRVEGLDTFVLGLTGGTPFPRLAPIYLGFLERMARAGGRARTTSPPYLDARVRSEIEQSLTRPLLETALCRLVRSDARVMLGDTLTSGGVSIVRDRSRRNGWDWSDDSQRAMQLYGAACDRAIERRVLSWNAPAEGRCELPE
jgi:hypothetical protein